MHSKLFQIGPLEIHSYGLMLALSFLVGIYFSMYRAKKQAIDPNKIADLAIIIVISAILGARFLYVIFHLEEFSGHWLDMINPFQSSGQVGIAGLTMLGGFVAAVVFGILYLKIKKLPTLKITDITIPAVAIGIFLTRIGCYLNGCCFGLPTESALGVVFPSESPAGFCFPDQHIHPAQLYSSFYGLAIFLLLMFFERHKKFDGFLLYLFFILYGVSRLVVDFYRYYENNMVIIQLGNLPISVNQGISVLMILVGAGLITYNLKWKPKTSDAG
ncbi:MAG TPA: prolipoprotein diacylglyceryl transferase [bacterium]|nr:prolipoprotein diacylglyceryl transferase [bacterium]